MHSWKVQEFSINFQQTGGRGPSSHRLPPLRTPGSVLHSLRWDHSPSNVLLIMQLPTDINKFAIGMANPSRCHKMTDLNRSEKLSQCKFRTCLCLQACMCVRENELASSAQFTNLAQFFSSSYSGRFIFLKEILLDLSIQAKQRMRSTADAVRIWQQRRAVLKPCWSLRPLNFYQKFSQHNWGFIPITPLKNNNLWSKTSCK